MSEFTDPIRIDLVDILALVAGVVLGMSVVFGLQDAQVPLTDLLRSDSELQDLTIGGSALLLLCFKRLFWPTSVRDPIPNLPARVLYLVAAIVGALLLVVAVLWAWVQLRDGRATPAGVGPIAALSMALGLGLMGTAWFIDRLFIRR